MTIHGTTDPLFLISLAKSGSDLLRGCLNQSDYFFDLPKIFDREWDIHRPVMQFEQCLGSIKSGNKPFVIVDIKYDSLHSGGNNGQKVIDEPELISWICCNQFPVVHIVRENPFDCLISQYSNCDSRPKMDASQVIQKISEMRSAVRTVDSWLQHTNSLDLKFENLQDTDGRISNQAVYQLCNFLKIDANSIETAVANFRSQHDQVRLANLKLPYRPELTRNGLGNLFDMPKAA